MEDNLNREQPQRRTTSMEDDLNGRRTQRKTTSMEDYLNGKWRMTSMEVDLKEAIQEADDINLPS